jgi:hypothetical protein
MQQPFVFALFIRSLSTGYPHLTGCSALPMLIGFCSKDDILYRILTSFFQGTREPRACVRPGWLWSEECASWCLLQVQDIQEAGASAPGALSKSPPRKKTRKITFLLFSADNYSVLSILPFLLDKYKFHFPFFFHIPSLLFRLSNSRALYISSPKVHRLKSSATLREVLQYTLHY